MELIDQHAKAIMEECKVRAKAQGLSFLDESLEYVVTNKDMIELSPKIMIPTLYDYWVHDVEVLKGKGKYELYPGNPYETVINTRPAISFYNDNNPDWLNVMIFYHVLGHIDFFQNNVFFSNTWDFDFAGRALSDKRLIAKLRSEKGHWVDYIIEFTRSIDNLVGYFDNLSEIDRQAPTKKQKRLDYYFDIFLQNIKKVSIHEYVTAVGEYNAKVKEFGERGEDAFFSEVTEKDPEFESFFDKYLETYRPGKLDVVQYIMEYSTFLNKDENKWMKSVMDVVRDTSLVFQPQIRTKILNEGWASYWHERLFLADERIVGHEVEYARINAAVTAMPRVGMNPYALGMRLFHYVEEMAEKGKFTYDFQRIANAHEREHYDKKTGNGQDFIFAVRKHFSDFLFINTFLDQDFVDKHNLFVAGKRLNRNRMVWEYYVKSRSVEDYRKMVLDSLYHPPRIDVDLERSKKGVLYLDHKFEGKPLYRDFIHNTMMGLNYLWGNTVQLETTEVVEKPKARKPSLVFYQPKEGEKKELQYQRVLLTYENKKLTRKVLQKL